MVAIENLTSVMFAPVRLVRSRRRTMVEWAEQEVMLPPGGPCKGRYRTSRQPFTRHLLNELGSGRWNMVVTSGPSQSSKTLSANVIPTLYVAAELKENQVYAVPEADMADDKWKTDMLPVLQASPTLRHLIPTSGPGSKGGKVKDRIDLTNGASLKIMTANSSDTAVAGFTVRVVNVTEVAGFSGGLSTSKEATKLRQLAARQRSFSRERRLMNVEGTVTIPTDLPWRLKGSEDEMISTMSELVSPCPHCPAWISPGRDDFKGWSGARTAEEAMSLAFFYCPQCGHEITEEERLASNQHVQLIHQGQHINKHGDIVGGLPPTSTLWFHWSQWHNCLVPAADHAAEEWEKEQIPEHTEEWLSKEKELCQFIWSIPYDPPMMDLVPLTDEEVVGRSIDTMRRGVVPPGVVKMSGGVDLRGTQLHYTIIAWFADGRGHVMDVGVVPIEHQRYGSKRALLKSLRKFRDEIVEVGYKDAKGTLYRPQVMFVDAGWRSDVVRIFVRESIAGDNKRYFPSFGRGQSQPRGKGSYQHPTNQTKDRPYIGDQFYLKRDQKYGLYAAFINSDEWKTNVHDAFSTPADQPGSLSLFDAVTEDELALLRSYSRHIVSEKAQEKIVLGRGTVTVWVNPTGRQNHHLDTTYLAMAAGHLAGVRVVVEETQHQPRQVDRSQQRRRFTTPDGRPFLVSNRR